MNYFEGSTHNKMFNLDILNFWFLGKEMISGFSFSSRHFKVYDMSCHKLLFLSDKIEKKFIKFEKITFTIKKLLNINDKPDS